MADSKLANQLYKKLHHAYVVEGAEDVLMELEAALLERGFQTKGNPDFISKSYPEGFGVNDARELKRMHLSKPIVGDKKFFLIHFTSITVEAQNALLKILEEPGGQSHFFLVTPNSNLLLPTVLSRVEVIRGSGEQKYTEDSKEFLSASIPRRLEIAESVAKAKDVGKARSMVSGIEGELQRRLQKDPSDKSIQEALNEVLKMEMYIKGRSPSVKMILEHLALVLPVFK